MSQIPSIQDRLAETREEIARVEKLAEGSLGHQIALHSLRSFEQQLREELRAAMLDRQVEVVEFRLQGKVAADGQLPLDVLSGFALNLHRSLYAAAAYRKSGQVLKRGAPPRLTELLDVQLAGIAAGSTRLYVRANTAPDLFGNSLIEETLRATFDLLNADSAEGAFDAIEEVGPASAQRFRELMEDLRQHNLELDITWADTREERHVWRGSARRMEVLTSAIRAMKTEDVGRALIGGVVEGMNLRGRLELRDYDQDNGERGSLYRITYSFDTIDAVRRLRLGDEVTARVRKTRMRNEVTRRDQVVYFLESIQPMYPPE